jgi:hypothetical protein
VQAFGEITARSSNCTSPAQLRQTTPQLAVVGLFRDLRGIAAATATRRWVLVTYICCFYVHQSTFAGQDVQNSTLFWGCDVWLQRRRELYRWVLELRQTTPPTVVVGLLRDLRCTAAATANRRWVLVEDVPLSYMLAAGVLCTTAQQPVWFYQRWVLVGDVPCVGGVHCVLCNVCLTACLIV